MGLKKGSSFVERESADRLLSGCYFEVQSKFSIPEGADISNYLLLDTASGNDVPKALLDKAAELGVTHMACGTRERSTITSFLLGSCSRYMRKNAPLHNIHLIILAASSEVIPLSDIPPSPVTPTSQRVPLSQRPSPN